MKLGIQISNFGAGEPNLGSRVADAARAADDAGCASLWLMDHFFQLPGIGSASWPMVEAYATLAYLAGLTSHARLGTLVTGVTYRHPGILAKTVTSLDVLSGGRAALGIGAGWYEREHQGLGIPFPPLAERFERLEEALQIVLAMWSGETGPYTGRHYRLAETLNVPQPLTRPHPPLLIGGGGEQRTLRLVAQYADACNLPGLDPAGAAGKLASLKRHCEALGRDYDAIEKTALSWAFVSSAGGSVSPGDVLRLAESYHSVGLQHLILSVNTSWSRAALQDVLGEAVREMSSWP